MLDQISILRLEVEESSAARSNALVVMFLVAALRCTCCS